MAETTAVLLVEDEAAMRELVRLYLEREGFAVDEADNGEAALAKVNSRRYDLVILDLMLPKLDGWTVCKAIRTGSDTPVIILTARGEESDRILGFELGADDYVVKPFSPRELVARAKALLRRTATAAGPRYRELLYPPLSLNPEAREVKVDGQPVALTPKEYDLLYFLARQPYKVFTREQLLENVWGYDFYGDLRTVDTHIKNLREKLHSIPQGYIATVWGVGYKFEPPKS